MNAAAYSATLRRSRQLPYLVPYLASTATARLPLSIATATSRARPSPALKEILWRAPFFSSSRASSFWWRSPALRSAPPDWSDCS